VTAKPGTVSEYGSQQTELAERLLLEIWSRLGDYHEHLVLVGGLVPRYIVPQGDPIPPHCGTMDVDMGVELAVSDLRTYTTIRETLIDSLGFEPGKNLTGKEQRHSFVKALGGTRLILDFLTTNYGGPPERVRQVEENLSAIQVEGLGLALRDPLVVHVEGESLEGGLTKAAVRVYRPVPFVVLKALALAKRRERKDAYDLIYVLRFSPGGPTGLAASAAEFERAQGSFVHALQELRSMFDSPEHDGATRYARFVQDQEDNPAAQAYAAVQEFLESLGAR
jgi:hypothetical protein